MLYQSRQNSNSSTRIGGIKPTFRAQKIIANPLPHKSSGATTLLKGAKLDQRRITQIREQKRISQAENYKPGHTEPKLTH